MRKLISIIFFIFMYQVHAGDLIILDNYYLDKIERESSVSTSKIERVNDARGPVTQIEVEHRNIDDYTIRRNKNRRVHKNNEDSPLLQYHF